MPATSTTSTPAGSYDVLRRDPRSARADGSLPWSAEVPGRTYHRDRDLTGFEDGTENPTLASAPAYALVPDGSPGAGGSVLLLQQWVHDATAWWALADDVQEDVIGRTKTDSIELDPKPETSHAARTDQDDFGHVLRRNTAYGTVSDHGTMFVGFASSKEPLHVMLQSMAGVDGPRDALTRFTTPTHRQLLLGAAHLGPAPFQAGTARGLRAGVMSVVPRWSRRNRWPWGSDQSQTPVSRLW